LDKNVPFAIYTVSQWWLKLPVSAANNYQTAQTYYSVTHLHSTPPGKCRHNTVCGTADIFNHNFPVMPGFTAVLTRTVLTQRTAKQRGRKDDKDENHRDPTGT
jgi:hypothetical protein